MTTTTRAQRSYRTGFCGIGRHELCTTAKGLCRCDCGHGKQSEDRIVGEHTRTGAGVLRVAGYIIAGPESAHRIVADWSGEIHSNLDAAKADLAGARAEGHRQYGIYELRLVTGE